MSIARVIEEIVSNNAHEKVFTIEMRTKITAMEGGGSWQGSMEDRVSRLRLLSLYILQSAPDFDCEMFKSSRIRS